MLVSLDLCHKSSEVMINSTKSLALGAGNVSEPRFVSQVP